MTKPELLSPAGSLACAKAAVNAGADAIYIGGTRFGARAYADNPDDAGLIDALHYCHFHGRKMYLTVNTLFKEKEMPELYEFIRPLYEEGLDAVIVQDYGAVAFIRENFPGLDIHASTQIAAAGYYGARMLGELGISRLILPRESSLTDIKSVTERGGLETEVFVHGALCYCVSGKCLFSSMLGGRSGNRGRCAQVCRLEFEGGRLLNLKDLSTLSILPDIIDTGVSSLKIEGRMKSPVYTAGVTGVYRKYIDMYFERGREGYKVSNTDRHILSELFNRGGFTEGYFTSHNDKNMIFKGEKPKMRIVDENIVRKTEEKYIKKDIKRKIKAKVTLRIGELSVLELECGKTRVSVLGDMTEAAKDRPLTDGEIQSRIGRLGDSGFEAESIIVETDGDVFLPVSSLNRLRRDGVSELEREIQNGYKRTYF